MPDICEFGCFIKRPLRNTCSYCCNTCPGFVKCYHCNFESFSFLTNKTVCRYSNIFKDNFTLD